MRKLLTITLLVVHLFNLAGYSFLFSYLTARSSAQLTKKIDDNKYNGDHLIEIKVPLNMPYYQSVNTDYERHYGEIDINGQHHHYVKRKVSQDTLYLLCIANTKNDQLKEAKNKYASDTNDFDSTHKRDVVKKANITSDYQQDFSEYHLNTPEKVFLSPTPHGSADIIESFIAPKGKPPRINS